MRRLGALILGVMIFINIILPALLTRGCLVSPSKKAPQPRGGITLITIKVYLEKEKRILEMPLEEYLMGVVAAETPASFEPEALKAQAVAARTYALKRMRQFGGRGSQEHPGADICTDPQHGQAWVSWPELTRIWGNNYTTYRKKVEEAVLSTSGLVIVYNGFLIDPVFHSTSGGRTENSEDVWSEKVPYLRSVVCDYDRHSPYYQTTLEMTLREMARKLGNAVPTSTLSNGGGLRVLERSDTGRIKTIRVGGQEMKGTDFRTALGLPSTNFTWEYQGDKIRFTVRGYGHGVGMSQYGADGLARNGKNYIEILQYFYTGVKIMRAFEE
ncbi:MAG: stage II sporulation protein D [Firmicutes bacterium]|nr:stage II sporulation protein D [Bacillota bacterium]